MSNGQDVTMEELLRHERWIRRLARSLVHDDASADDVVQQTWLAALRSRPSDPSRTGAWLATVARNAALRLRRDDGRRRVREESSARGDAVPSTATLVERLAVQRDVVGEVMKLEEPYQTAVLLRFYEDMKPAEIARFQGVPLGTVESRLRRGVLRLRERLDARHAGSRELWCRALLVAGGGFGMKVSTKAAVAVAILGFVVGGGSIALRTGKEPQQEARVRPPAMAPMDESVPSSAGPTQREWVSREAHPTAGGAALPEQAQRFEVASVDGEAAAAAAVALFRGEELLAQGATDETGGVVLAACDGQAALLVDWPGAYPSLHEVELTGGIQRIDLPRGAEVAGHVLIDGVAPNEAIELRLQTEKRIWFDVPEAVWEAMEYDRSGGPAERVAVTDSAGAFRIHGLAPDFSGSIRLDTRRHGLLRDGVRGPPLGNAVQIPRPTSNLLLDLRSYELLHGRIVRGGVAVAEGQVGVKIFLPDAGHTKTAVHANALGGFEIPIWYPNAVRIDLDLADAKNRGVVTRSLDGPFDADVDLGSIELEPPRNRRLRVLDELGKPIEGARTHVSWNHEPPSEPSGVDGWIDFGYSTKYDECWVTAVGFEFGRVDLARSDLSTLSLSRSTSLDLVAEGLGGGPTRGVLFLVDSTDRPFGFPVIEINAPSDPIIHWKVNAGGGASEGAAHFRLKPDESGTARIGRLRPAAMLSVRAVDSLGMELARRSLALAPGETRREVFSIESDTKTLSGYVRDKQGHPVMGASVTVAIETRYRQAANTDRDGRYELDGLRARGVVVLVKASGYASQRRELVMLSGTSPTHDIVLDEGHDVRLRIVDESGLDVSNAKVSAWSPWSEDPVLPIRVRSDTRESGEYLLSRVPSQVVTLQVEVGGQVYHREISSHQARATLEVPRHGTVAVSWVEGLEGDRPYRIRLVPIGQSEASGFHIGVVGGAVLLNACEVPMAPAGRYQVYLECEEGDDFIAVASGEVTVEAYRTVHAQLAASPR